MAAQPILFREAKEKKQATYCRLSPKCHCAIPQPALSPALVANRLTELESLWLSFVSQRMHHVVCKTGTNIPPVAIE